tara:strand:- start:7052 stop:7894 length:843 start_codon:yes stop_codon:yes gene_type:complete
MKKIVFVADFFSDQVLGGGELNNDELINIIVSKEYQVTKLNSDRINDNFIDSHPDSFYIIANFVMIPPKILQKITTQCDYVIYEHDHKYLKNRNPGIFNNFIAPKEQVINLTFYRNAKAVFLQSTLHKEIVFKNTGLKNLINLGGNIWSVEALNTFKKNSLIEKNNSYAIMDSLIDHKNTSDAVAFCKIKNYDFNLIKSENYINFLEMLGKHKGLVFFPKTPETLSRIVVESRMMGMSVITNNMVGATSEKWYSFKGESLVDLMCEKREQITNKVLEFLN